MKLNAFLILLSFFLFSKVIFSQGISSSEINNLSENQINVAKDILGIKDLPNIMQVEEKVRPESTIKSQFTSDPNNLRDKKYGYDFISSIPTSIFATGDLPLPNEYKISIRDKLSVLLSGSRDEIIDLPVKLDGTILFPELGSINVAGKSLKEVKDLLSALIERSYIGVQIDVSIKDLSAKKISIVGAVKNPGTYLINPFSTITSALAYSGGISEIGTLRNIKLKRIDGEEFSFDLYQLLINGDRSNDITIEAGDVIIVGAAGQFINLSGSIIRPAIYEIKNNENLEDIIKFGLGFKGEANREKISLQTLNYETSQIQTVITSNLKSELANITSIIVFPIINKASSGINVFGAVKEPGFYDLKSNNSLKSLIESLEFIDVYPWLAVLEQFDDENLIRSSFLFNLYDSSTYESIKLLPNSKLHFSNLKNIKFDVEPLTAELIEDYKLRINHKQGTFSLPVFGKFSVKDFVNFLGLDMSEVDKEATYISPLEDKVIKKDYELMEFIASKYHTISFRSPINDLISVDIFGSIEYPGTYTLNSNSTLEDLYKLVGSFKTEAFLDGIIFTRSSIKERQLEAIQKSKKDLNESILTSASKGEIMADISIIQTLASISIEPENLGRIAGDFSPNTSAASNTILRDGDSIFVPKLPNVINVLGEVLNPIAFEFTKKLSLKGAISKAGGYKDYAAKNKVYVIKANGVVQKAKRNIFTRNVRLEVGDSIIVPRKIITNNPGIDLLIPITQVLSDIAFSAAAIDSLRD